jgi:enterochelin esterase-like enzyme
MVQERIHRVVANVAVAVGGRKRVWVRVWVWVVTKRSLSLVFGMRPFRTVELSPSLAEFGGLRFATVHSTLLGGRADVTLWAPSTARPADLPLVILLHGVYGSHWAWALKGRVHHTARRLIEAGEIPPMALVMPSDGLRGDGTAYIPQGSGNYERWIVDEVPCVAREAVPEVTTASPCFISGLSMGGFGALRLGARHSGFFRGISAHSAATSLRSLAPFLGEPLPVGESAVEDPTALEALVRHRASLPPVRFDCGVDDFLIGHNRDLHASLEKAGVPHDYVEFPGGHTWEYWEQNVEHSLRFFGKILMGTPTGGPATSV